MTPSAIALLVGAAAFSGHVFLTLILLRLPGRLSPVVRHAGSAATTHVAGAILGGLVVEPFPYWPFAAVTGFGAVVWLFAFSAVYKSVSLRILSQLARTPGNAIPLPEVTSRYVVPEFEARVAVLEQMGCAEVVEKGHGLTPKGAATARRIRAVQRLCGIERSGLYGDQSRPTSGPGR